MFATGPWSILHAFRHARHCTATTASTLLQYHPNHLNLSLWKKGPSTRVLDGIQFSRAINSQITTPQNNKNSEGDGDENDNCKNQIHKLSVLSPSSCTQSNTVITFMNTSFKGIGQVLFLNSELAGKILLTSLLVGDPIVAALAVLGTGTATLTAIYTIPYHNNNSNHSNAMKIRDGIFGYNGCLIGCATAVLVAPHTTISTMTMLSQWTVPVLTTMIGAVTTTKMTQFILAQQSPQQQQLYPHWTYVFNFVTLSILLLLLPLQQQSLLLQQQQQLSSTTTTTIANSTMANAATTVTTPITSNCMEVVEIDPQLLLSWVDLLVGVTTTSPLLGLSQIFVLSSIGTGMGILVAIASYSPRLAGHAILGSVTGTLVGVVHLLFHCPDFGTAAESTIVTTFYDAGSPTNVVTTTTAVAATTTAMYQDILIGLWGYNSALVSMGVGVFFRDTPQSRMLSAIGAAIAANMFGAFQVVFAMAGVPCLTLPFCLTMSGCYMLGLRGDGIWKKGLQLASNPHSPEKNG